MVAGIRKISDRVCDNCVYLVRPNEHQEFNMCGNLGHEIDHYLSDESVELFTCDEWEGKEVPGVEKTVWGGGRYLVMTEHATHGREVTAGCARRAAEMYMAWFEKEFALFHVASGGTFVVYVVDSRVPLAERKFQPYTVRGKSILMYRAESGVEEGYGEE